MEINLFQFSAAKTLVEVQKLNELWRQSTGFNDFRAKAESVTRVFNQSWLRTEYDTAYHVAESSATYYRLKSLDNTFPYWEYKTIGDEKVREEHRALNGIIPEYNNELWDKIYPPNGWNCRCYVVPRMRHEVDKNTLENSRGLASSYLKTPEWKKNQVQGFGVNRALTAEVFRANQMYIRKLPSVVSKYLNRLTYTQYNQDHIAKLTSSAITQLPEYSGTDESWAANHSINGVITLTDWLNRSYTIDKKSV